ncbi:hypothetical protein A3762_05040 [Oleiphilus sp. HI0125]|uniref:autotransporter outer membrane beta-barrel domain-containing protein n=1 Tax=Oleiphilus sp. HI0125 TaxID=1822266 RepID=UPI0007C259E3|nr:autotransporter outer membrane beta-barrel domain-containing protein [Oleiphilus sp. HI0125]KZZ59458.1 hypothetical protein A3762_05040 [Oleiphilus sp. HI0125]
MTTESSRSTTLGSISETAEAEYDSQLNYLGLRARYDTSWLEQVDSSAYIGLAYLRADQDEFSETNAPNLGMTIDRAIVSSGVISLGMEASRALNEFDSTHMRTELRYDYDVQADSNSVALRLILIPAIPRVLWDKIGARTRSLLR